MLFSVILLLALDHLWLHVWNASPNHLLIDNHRRLIGTSCCHFVFLILTLIGLILVKLLLMQLLVMWYILELSWRYAWTNSRLILARICRHKGIELVVPTRRSVLISRIERKIANSLVVLRILDVALARHSRFVSAWRIAPLFGCLVNYCIFLILVVWRQNGPRFHIATLNRWHIANLLHLMILGKIKAKVVVIEVNAGASFRRVIAPRVSEA